MNIFKQEIQKLINSKREDDFWDFKEMHYENNAELLHDILCMANNTADRDSYLILGVEDKSYRVIGVNNDPNRKTQQNIIDFLRSKSFSAGIRPKIELRTVEINNLFVDIIIILNSKNTPYFLIKDYRDNNKIVKSFHIYTRVGDTNTSINDSADINHIEYLWKKRFGMHLTPYNKFKLYLQDKNNWNEEKSIINYAPFPEYTINHEYENNLFEKEKHEFYSFNQTDTTTYYGEINLNYVGTTLYTSQTLTLDGGRFITVTPEIDFIKHQTFNNQITSFRYYLQDSMKFELHKFLLDENNHEYQISHRKFMKLILTFKNELEKNSFVLFIEDNINKFISDLNGFDDVVTYFDHLQILEKKHYLTNYKVAIILKKYKKIFNLSNN